MATTTSNYNLIKPALTDVADITAFNSNWDTIDTNLKKASESGGTPTVTATSTDGVAYTATASNITELTNGLTITIIPNRDSASTSITLNVNGLGAKSIVIPLSMNTGTSVAPKDTTFIVANRPLTLQYDSRYSTYGGWRTLGKQKTSASDLYGTVPVASGGTGKDSVTAGSFLLGNGTEAMVEKTPAEVRTTLDVYTKTEVQNYVTTQINAITDYEAVSF